MEVGLRGAAVVVLWLSCLRTGRVLGILGLGGGRLCCVMLRAGL